MAKRYQKQQPRCIGTRAKNDHYALFEYTNGCFLLVRTCDQASLLFQGQAAIDCDHNMFDIDDHADRHPEAWGPCFALWCSVFDPFLVTINGDEGKGWLSEYDKPFRFQ